MSFQLKGILTVKADEQRFSEKFKKRDFVVEISDGNYAQHIKFQLTQERCNLIDDIEIGGELDVFFNLKGRPYEKDGKTTYFTNLEAWKIENHSVKNESKAEVIEAIAALESDEPNDGLPF